jgi:predicted secreted acid phosphatase
VKLAIATLIASMLAGGGLALAGEPKAPASPEDIVAYRDSGEWREDNVRAIRRARRVVARHVFDPRPAIVLDVDDTALSTYSCMKAAGFDRAEAGCGRRRDLPAVRATLRLFRYTRSHGVAVFFVTGRREELRRATAANLRRAGFRGYRGLRMRPDDQPASRRDGWKARTRRALERRGYRIVVNVGDQRSDLDQGHALRAIKLPNPMYVIETA